MNDAFSGMVQALSSTHHRENSPRRARRPKPGLSPGDVVNEWTLLEYVPGRARPDRAPASWRCQCTCGTVRLVRRDYLVQGLSKSCGHAIRAPKN